MGKVTYYKAYLGSFGGESVTLGVLSSKQSDTYPLGWMEYSVAVNRYQGAGISLTNLSWGTNNYNGGIGKAGLEAMNVPASQWYLESTGRVYVTANKYFYVDNVGRIHFVYPNSQGGSSQYIMQGSATYQNIPLTNGPKTFYVSNSRTNTGQLEFSQINVNESVLADFWNGAQEITGDPYADGGGTSGTGGGTGNFDGTSDSIDFPSLPTLSAVNTGFITLYNPSTLELQALANYMWGDLFDLNTWKKIFADPMDAILGLSIVPVAVPNAGGRVVTVGNISTGVTLNAAATQYVEVDCGILNVNEFWGAYLDYDPFTKAEIYLPYIGTHPLSVDDIMGKPVHIKYHVDILSGACCAFIKCGDSVLYTFVGQCSCSIPITGNDWTNVVNGALSIAASIGTMVATGGSAAPMAATAIASTAVNSMKPSVEKSGSLGGTGGMLGVQTPYLILTRPNQAVPAGQNAFMGYPSFITRGLSEITGYTEIESIHLNGVPCTEQELSEIVTLLKGGVIL